METDERIASLENRLEAYDALVCRLIAYARLTRGGRVALAAVGLK